MQAHLLTKRGCGVGSRSDHFDDDSRKPDLLPTQPMFLLGLLVARIFKMVASVHRRELVEGMIRCET